MEYYHYINIFETKGLEYILVISFLITFVFFIIKLETNSNLKSQSTGPVEAGDLPEPIVIVKNSTSGDTRNTTDVGQDAEPQPPSG